jgi:hypothetical protein
MDDFNLQKKKIESYFGTRKYKLSFWGFNPHVDWYIMVGYFFVALILIFILGIYQKNDVINKISTEIQAQDKTIKNFDTNSINEMLYSDYKIQDKIIFNNQEIITNFEVSNILEAEDVLNEDGIGQE